MTGRGVRRTALRYGAVALASVLVVNGALFLLFGLERVAAVSQHPETAYRTIAGYRDLIVRLRAEDVTVPEGFAPAATDEGLRLYMRHCASCHGAPGIAPESFALGMNPLPPSIVATALERPPEQIFWFVKYGVRMTGMPAWDLRLDEREMWAVTAAVASMPSFSPAGFAERLAEIEDAPAPALASSGGAFASDLVERGRRALSLYGCASCHRVPGVVGRDVRVGPPLENAAARRYVAGVLENTPENLARWIANPQEIDPLTAMPDLGVDEEDAAAIAAYLYSLIEPEAIEGLTAAGAERIADDQPPAP